MRMLAVGGIALGLFAAPAGSQTSPPSGFDQLKKLVGEWQSTDPKGVAFTNTIRLVSNGTALEETFQNSKDNQMVTLYSPDGNRVAVTHYCSAGNQPRMETDASTSDQKEFSFFFQGATNLASPESGHMHHLTIKIADNDHFSEEWTWHENGKDQSHAFQFTRKKS
jgi:hypothetical protein